jgi:hypothetical protein
LFFRFVESLLSKEQGKTKSENERSE